MEHYAEPFMGDYSKCKPIPEVCGKLRKENENGTYIILYTSRNMRSFQGNIGLINKYTSRILHEWLESKIYLMMSCILESLGVMVI